MTTTVDVLRGSHIKAGDTLPAFRAKLLEEGDGFNLTDYDVTMKMKLAEGDGLTVNDTATADQENRGIVEYEWSADETNTAGTYEIQFVADDGAGNVISFPNSGFARLYIEGGLD